MIGYYVLLRVGWIFKTESIIMPAVLDSIGGSGLLRGFLPVLNRFGQSIPPLLASDRMKKLPRKKYALAACSFSMGMCFVVLSTIWLVSGGQGGVWLPVVFLIVYAIFFASVGLHNLSNSLLQGKLLPVRIRGRFMFFGMTIGSTIAVLGAWFILRRWLGETTGQFSYIFAFTGFAFLIASGASLFLNEEPENFGGGEKSIRDILRGCLGILTIDKNFRRLAIVACLFGMTVTLMPHYQALGRGRLELGLTALVPWVIAQSIGAACFSIPLGWIADRLGNRLVLKVLMLLMALAPILALLITHFGSGMGARPFMLVFFMLGLFPVGMRTFSNYTLEIASAKHQPKYLSTLSLCMALPGIFASLIVGKLVDFVGFEFAFVLVASLVFAGWITTFGLKEPRQNLTSS